MAARAKSASLGHARAPPTCAICADDTPRAKLDRRGYCPKCVELIASAQATGEEERAAVGLVRGGHHCHYCWRRLVPIGSARKNGKAHEDWESRRMHKGCWALLQKAAEDVEEFE